MKNSIPIILIGLLVLGSAYFLITGRNTPQDQTPRDVENTSTGTRLRDGSGEGAKRGGGTGMGQNNGMGPGDGTGVRNQLADMDDTEMGFMDISPEEAIALIENNPELIIVDVSPYYDQGHLPGAINAYVSDGTLDEMLTDWDPNATYLVYCHSDTASILGAQKLVDAGFENVYRLEGNYSAWLDAGYEVEM